MQKVLVTGGAGFIGSHLSEKLLADGHEVICVDNFLTGSRENISHLLGREDFRLIEHDVIRPLAEDLTVDAVFHLASPASPNHHSSVSYHAFPMETMLVNTRGTLQLLKLAEKNKAKFLFASTSEVYGDPEEHPQKESYTGNVNTIGPRSVYDEAKRFGETLTSYFQREKGVDTRIARIFNTYGPRMGKDDKRMIIQFISQALRGAPITIFGDGTQTRSLCYIADLVDGLSRLMFAEAARGEVVNLGATEENTVLEYATMVKKLTNSQSEIIHSEDLPADDPKKRRPDITKASDLLHWEPKIGLEEGLQRTIDFVKKSQ